MKHARMSIWAAVPLLLLAGAARAADKVVMAIPNKALSLAPLFLAIDGGAMKTHGVDMQMVQLTGGPPVNAALLGGNVQYATMADDALMELAPTGKVICVYTYTNSFTQNLQVRNSILAARKVGLGQPWQDRVRGLKGFTMGVLALGGSSDLAGRWLWHEAGLDAAKDLTSLRIGAVPAMIAALKQGTIDGFVGSSPAREIVEGGGFGAAIVRFDEVAAWADEPFIGIETLASYLGDHKDLTRRIVQALAEAQKQVYTDPKSAAAILAQGSLSGTAEPLLVTALSSMHIAFRPATMSDARWQSALKTHAAVNPAVASVVLKEGVQWTNEFFPR